MINQPLMEETRADYGRQYADRRVRALRFVVVTFLVLIVVGATLTSLRLMRISRGQAYIDASYPACRKGYALGAYGTQQGPAKLLLWSGKADSNCMWINELCDDMWLFDADTHAPPNGTSKWTELDREDAGAYLQSSKRPEPRWKTIAVQDEQENLFIFAGDPLRADGSFIDDVWKLSAGTFEWRRLAPTCSSSDSALNADDDDRCMSLERRAHAAAYSAGKVYMHGGKSPTSSLLNDMWALDVRKLQWTLLNDGSELEVARQLAPPARKGHTLVTVDSLYCNSTGKYATAIVLFAGRVDINLYFNDVWAFFPTARRWERLDTAPAPTPHAHVTAMAPHPRDHHAAAVVGNGMYTIGGWYKYWHAFDDVWRFDLDERTWTAIQPTSAVVPQGRFLISLLPIGTDLFMFGGELGSDEPGAQANGYLNDVWAFSTTTREWIELSPSRCPRDHTSAPRPPHVPDDDDEDDGEHVVRAQGPLAKPGGGQKAKGTKG